ncbi:MAG: baseplate J/gp47 family protein [Anaerolineae bacterium]|nr:baseplate J/gp47 family protein [Anaerolineae bacterium]
MKEQIIHLEAHDDITSVRDKLGWIRAARVLLVFPDDPAHPILQRKLDLVLLQREATRQKAQLALITKDPIVIENARDLRLACFPTVEASHKRYWRTPRARMKIDRSKRPASALDADLIEAATRLRSTDKRLSPRQRRTIQIALLGSTLFLLIAGIILIAPSAIVKLEPAANQVSVTTTVIADPEATAIDNPNRIIPARVVGIEVDASETIDVTGVKDVPSEKAQGTALFTNLLDDQVNIPAGTIIRTSAALPVRFVTLADATIPGKTGETVEVPIEAVDPGFEGNLPSNRINEIEGLLASRIAVTNPQPTHGGDVTETQAISQEDYDRVRSLALQQIQQRAYASMQTDPFIALQETEFIPAETLAVVLIDFETYSGPIGQEAEKVSLDMRATVQSIAIDERLARQAAYVELSKRVGAGYQISAESLLFRRGEVTQIDDQRRVTFIMHGTGEVLTDIPPARVRQLVHGRTIDTAKSRLEGGFPLTAPPDIEVWPGFWPIMPLLQLRIQVDISGGI